MTTVAVSVDGSVKSDRYTAFVLPGSEMVGMVEPIKPALNKIVGEIMFQTANNVKFAVVVNGAD